MLLEDKLRRRSEHCLSDLALDRLVVFNARGAALPEAAKAHLDSCESCEARLGALRQAHARFSLAPPSSSPFRSARRRLWLAASLASAAVVLILALALLPKTRAPAKSIGRKGSVSFGVYVLRDQRVQRGRSGDAYFPGDRLRFFYTSDQPTHLAIFDVESSGAITPFVASGQHAKALPPGSQKLLEDTIELDDALGEETLVGVFCPHPFELKTVQRALQTRGFEAFAPQQGCELKNFTLLKRSR